MKVPSKSLDPHLPHELIWPQVATQGGANNECLHSILIFCLISPGIDVVVDGTWTVMKNYFFSHLKKNIIFSFITRKVRNPTICNTIRFNLLNNLQYDFDFQNNG